MEKVNSKDLVKSLYVEWGADDNEVNRYDRLYNKCTLHKTLLMERMNKDHAILSLKEDSIGNFDSCCCNGTIVPTFNSTLVDLILYGNAFIEVSREDGRVVFTRLNPHICRVAKDGKGIVVLGSAEFDEVSIIPFEPIENGGYVIHIKSYALANDGAYGLPDYYSALDSIEAIIGVNHFNKSRAASCFRESGVMLLDDAVENECEAEKIIETAQDKFNSAGQILFVVKDGAETDHSTFIPIKTDKDWENVLRIAIEDVTEAHKLQFNAYNGFIVNRIQHALELGLDEYTDTLELSE